MNANKLSQLTGVAKETLRYYEKVGVITPPERSANGYRIYQDWHIRELKFIKLGQSVGFTLNTIKEAIPKLKNPDPNCPILEKVLSDQVNAIDEKIAELQQAKSTLNVWLARNSGKLHFT
jgi:MerR family copper efflux transcriptional regulator